MNHITIYVSEDASVITAEPNVILIKRGEDVIFTLDKKSPIPVVYAKAACFSKDPVTIGKVAKAAGVRKDVKGQFTYKLWKLKTSRGPNRDRNIADPKIIIYD